MNLITQIVSEESCSKTINNNTEYLVGSGQFKSKSLCHKLIIQLISDYVGPTLVLNNQLLNLELLL